MTTDQTIKKIILRQIIEREKPVFLYFCLFMLFLVSMRLWIGWDRREGFFSAVLGIMASVAIVKEKVRLNYSNQNIISLLVIIFAFFYLREVEIHQILSYFLPVVIILFLNDKDRVRCLDFIFKWFALLLIPSIILYVICHVVELPSFGVISIGETNAGYQPYKNYILYALPTSSNYYWRFNGPFLEPGHLGMMSAFLLFATEFKLKDKRTWVLLLGVLLSLSLAGYVLALVGFILIMFTQGRLSLKYVSLFLVVIFSLYIYGTYYNGGENILNEKIFSRLETDEDRGFTGNNRAFGMIPLYYEMMWSNTKTLLFGYSRETIQWLAEHHGSRGTGFVMYMVSHGIVGTIVAMSFYFLYSLLTREKTFAFIAFFFVCTVFWQRSYPFWFSWIICYVYGITNYSHLKRCK